jgi:20S proteasome subunit alpha 5
LSLKDAQLVAVRILKEVMEEKLDPTNAQIAIVTRENGFHIFSETELETLINSL